MGRAPEPEEARETADTVSTVEGRLFPEPGPVRRAWKRVRAFLGCT